jgi:DNA-binding NtrC family response regulator
MTPHDAVESSRGRVLVVDDDEDCCLALGALLRGEGYEVELAASAERALVRIAEHPPDVLVSDIRMPGMDGFALLREVSAGRDLPVILMSGDGKPEAEVRSAGAAAYLEKPLDISLVIRAIDDALAASAARRRSVG